MRLRSSILCPLERSEQHERQMGASVMLSSRLNPLKNDRLKQAQFHFKKIGKILLNMRKNADTIKTFTQKGGLRKRNYL